IIAKGKDKENGGFVETSGKYLGVGNTANVEAKDWLLDPYNVRIVAGSGDSTNTNMFTATGNDAVIYNTTITAALNKGTNVTITTDNPQGKQEGNLTVDADIIKTGNKDATLTLIANGTFSQNKQTTIKSTSGKLNVNITSGHGLVLKGEIDTNEGDLNINAFSRKKNKSNPNPNFSIDGAVLKGKGIVRITGSADYLYNLNEKKAYNNLTINDTTFKGYGNEGLTLQYNAINRDWYDGKYVGQGGVLFANNLTKAKGTLAVSWGLGKNEQCYFDYQVNLDNESETMQIYDVKCK
ncbi:conserved hypothetical protein, partial [Haemophilus influenzae HK1212]